MSRVGTKDWLPNTYYDVDDFVVVNDLIEYRCIASHTSGSAFSDTNREVRIDTTIVPLSGGSGIIIDGSNKINLGGDLNATITIDVNGNEFYIVGDHSEFFVSDDRFWASAADRAGFMDLWATYTAFGRDLSGGSQTSFNQIYINDTEMRIQGDSTNFAGLIYSANYASDYTNRSLPDVEYTDGKALTAQSYAPIVTQTAATLTLSDSHGTVLSDATSNAITITLPAASSYTGKIYTIKKIDNTTNTVTINADGTDLIDGVATQVISTQWSAITIHSNGSNRFII